MRKIALVVAMAGALALVGCGSSSDGEKTVTVTKVATAPAVTSTTPMVSADEPPEPEPEPVESNDCTELGITVDELNEGKCEEDGTKLKVVNRDTKLTLPEVAVKLNSIAHVDTIPREYDSPLTGSFVVANVTITNRLNAPVTLQGDDMFYLLLGKKTYTPNSEAMIYGSGGNLILEEIQPGENIRGDVIFKVRPKAASNLDTNGNLGVLQFSDADLYGLDQPEKRIGVIRTYH